MGNSQPSRFGAAGRAVSGDPVQLWIVSELDRTGRVSQVQALRALAPAVGYGQIGRAFDELKRAGKLHLCHVCGWWHGKDAQKTARKSAKS